MSFLEIKQLTKKFAKTTVFKDINLQIEKGEFIVLLGPSGCGKSTLLNCIAGLLSTDSGQIMMEGEDMNVKHPSKRDIAMVFQSYALYPNMTVGKNISFGMKVRRIPEKTIQEKVSQVAGILNITELLNRKPYQLSGGQQQRVAIGRALVRDPKLFLFDEPLSNLDAKLRLKMRTEIKRLHKNLKTTIIYVTHDQVEAMTLADKIAVINHGKVMQFASPKEIYFSPNSAFVAQFIGSPPMNLIPASITKNATHYQIGIGNKGKQASFSLAIPAGNTLAKAKHSRLQLKNNESRKILLGIRPENIYLAKNIAGSKKLSAWKLSMRLDFIEPHGADNQLILDLDGMEIICRLHSDILLPKTSETEFYLDLNKAIFYDAESGECLS